MKSAYHHIAALGFAALASVAALPAGAQESAAERSCSQLWPGDVGPCTPDRVPAHHATQTVPGTSPLQVLNPRSTVAERPWLKKAAGG